MSGKRFEKKEKDPRFRKLVIVKNLDTNVVNYNINGFGNPIDVDTLWGFIDNECNPNLIKQRIIAATRQQQTPSMGNKPEKEQLEENNAKEASS